MHRRRLVQLLSAGGIAAVGGYALFEYAPWLDYEAQERQVRGGLERNSLMGLVRYATLAASSHNTQPWRFVIKPGAIEIHPDYTRGLPVLDPENRELWISLGCALENLLITARASGYAPEVTYPDSDDFISVRLIADTPQNSPLFDAIPLRQNTRSQYDGVPVPVNDLDRLRALPWEPGVSLHFIDDPSGLKTAREYVYRGNLSQYADQAFVQELISWLRFNKKEVLASYDGLYSPCSGNPIVPRWLGQMVVSGTTPQQQADTDDKKLQSAPGVVIIASASEGKTAWIRTGQVYERLALQMTALNIKSAFLNQPIEVAGIRGQFQSALSLGKDTPQLLVRFGYSKAKALPRSLRRPVDQVILS